jgi:hypothetical protein
MYNPFKIMLMLCISTHLLMAQKWVKTIHTPNNETANVLKTLPDGDMLIGGQWQIAGDYWRASSLLIRSSSEGVVKWEKRFGQTDIEGNSITLESLEDMALMASGDVVLTGFAQPGKPNAHPKSDVLLARYNLNGLELWRKYYDLGGGDAGLGITETKDGGVIVCGRSNKDSLKKYDAFAMKISANGKQEWLKTWGQENDDEFDKVLRTPDGHFLLVGTIQLPSRGNRLFVVKVDASGNTIWERSFDNPAIIRGRDAVLLQNGGLLVAGMGYGANLAPMMAELAADGTLMWTKTYNTSGFGDFYGLATCESGNFYAVGIGSQSPFDGFLILNAQKDGAQTALDIFYADTPGSDVAKSVAFAMDGGIVVAGNKAGETNVDIVLMRFENPGCKAFTLHTADDQYLAQVTAASPNPFQHHTWVNLFLTQNSTVLIETFDLNGRLLWSREQALSVGEQTLEIPAAAVPAGQMAFYRIRAGGSVATGMVRRE